MSLRVRLIASIVVVLLVSLCVGGAAAGWHAVRSVRTELQAALAVGVQTLRNGIDGLPRARDPGNELERLVRAFDGIAISTLNYGIRPVSCVLGR